jgi:2,6-dihydroxypseudooxynicotine hydrolase
MGVNPGVPSPTFDPATASAPLPTAPTSTVDIEAEAHEVTIVLTRHHHRMIAAGIPYRDWDELRKQEPTTWREWYGYWTSLGAFYDDAATGALDAGRHQTAAEHWVTGSMCYQFAQFMLYRYPEPKRYAQAQRSRLYARALPLLRPTAQRLDVPFEDLMVPAVLRLPAGAQGPVPCVVIVPGLEATKEEMHNWEGFYLDRGMAAVALDGPGQGDLSAVPLDPTRYAAAASALAGVLRNDPRIDAGAIGIMGVSLGGMLASMTAALDGGFAAGAEVCGSFDTESRWARANALTRAGHRHVTQSASDEEVAERIRTWTLKDVAGKISCPFLVVHGENDPIVPLDQATMYQEHIPHAELVVMAGANHVCNNIANVSRPFITDWFADRLAH